MTVTRSAALHLACPATADDRDDRTPVAARKLGEAQEAAFRPREVHVGPKARWSAQAHTPLASRTASATFVACDTRPIFAPSMIVFRRLLERGTMPSLAVGPAEG